MIGDLALDLTLERHAALQTGDDPFYGQVKVRHRHIVSLAAHGQQRCLVDDIGQIGAGKAGGDLRQAVQVGVVRQGHRSRVNLEDLPSPGLVGERHLNLTVKASGPQQGLVQDFGAIGRGHDHHPYVGLKAVHLRQQLVECLFALVVGPDRALRRPGLANGVHLVDKDNAGSYGCRLFEQIADPSRAHANKELDKARTVDREEGNARLPCRGLGQQRLARTWRSHHQNALGQLGAQPGETVRFLQKLDNLPELHLHFAHTAHVLESDARHLARDHPVLAPAQG